MQLGPWMPVLLGPGRENDSRMSVLTPPSVRTQLQQLLGTRILILDGAMGP